VTLTGIRKGNTQSKTDITSDSLVVNNKRHIAVFTGHVVAIKGKLKILSSILNVVYTKKNKIKMLIATGNVHIIKGNDNITGGKAVYYDKKRIAVITENPIAYEGKNKIAGKKIMINFKTGISTVIGGKKRVNAIVYSNKSLSVQKPALKKNVHSAK
jgi:lipopolysaccharide transport protein LptA